jgi:hydroxymethylglutaryl-CoA reductase
LTLTTCDTSLNPTSLKQTESAPASNKAPGTTSLAGADQGGLDPESKPGATSVAGAGHPSSRISGFSRMSGEQRVDALIERGMLDPNERIHFLAPGNLTVEAADSFIENCVGCFSLPLGIATNFVLDGEEILVPMAVEESSVVAAASHGAKLVRSMGGFFSEATPTVATCQVQILTEPDVQLESLLQPLLQELKDEADACHPRLVARGGGVVGIQVRALPKPGYWALHVHVNTLEAMGANIVNTCAERLGALLPQRLPCKVGLKILTNLCDQRLTKVSARVSFKALELAGFSGEDAAERIERAWEFAWLDPYRAATHNKGTMNGIDPVVIATGNDWRAVEAGAHAYCARDGHYRPMTTWRVVREPEDSGLPLRGGVPFEPHLYGEICLPIAVGTVGGVTKLHSGAHAALKIMGFPSSARLSAIMASVGLAQNLAALRALACEGIQRGHMALHERNLEMLRRYDDVQPKL